MLVNNFIQWYFDLFSDSDNKVVIGAWSLTLTATTFLLTFLIKPSRVFILNYFRKKAPAIHSFENLEMKYSLEELKNKIKIIVIDDDTIFPIAGFKEFGYNIDQWYKLDTQKLKSLHNGDYDIIILDIYGVAKDIAVNDGLDVLQDLKSHNPAQVVVAYSGQSFDLSKNIFWELADEKLNKPTPFIGTQKSIDNLIEQTFTVDYHRDKLRAILKGNNLFSELNNLEALFISFKINEAEPDWIKELNHLSLKNGEKRKIASIFSKLFKFTNIVSK